MREAVLTGTAPTSSSRPSEAEMTRRWRELRAKNFPHLVAARDGAVLGYAYAGPYRPRPAYRYSVEDSIYIAPAAQGERRRPRAARRADRASAKRRASAR